MRIVFPVFALSITFLSANAALAQYPVNDANNIQQTSSIASNTSEEVARLGEVYDKLLRLNTTVGQQGPQQGASDVLSATSGLDGLAPRLAPSQGGAAADPTSITGMRSFAGQQFYATPSDPPHEDTIKTNRANAAREAGVNGFAVAEHLRADAAAMPARLTNLGQQIDGAQDVRQDLLAGNAALLLMLERLSQLEAGIAALTEIEATRSIQNDSTFVLTQTVQP